MGSVRDRFSTFRGTLRNLIASPYTDVEYATAGLGRGPVRLRLRLRSVVMVVMMMRRILIRRVTAATSGRRIGNSRNGAKAEGDREEEDQLAHRVLLFSDGRIRVGSLPGKLPKGNHEQRSKQAEDSR
jgi:hypothetical protein